MTQKTLAKKRLLLTLMSLRYFVPLAIPGLASFSLPMQASVVKLVTNYPNSQQNQSVQQPQLPDNGAPIGRRRGGTSRNDCPALNIPVTALVPGKEKLDDFQDSASFLASTISKHPTFWVYIPELPNNTRNGEFLLQDEAGEDIYRTFLTLPPTAAVISISLPSSPSYSLKIGKKYHWYFKIYCGKQEAKARYFYVDAWIERVALTPELDLKLKVAKSQKYLTYFDHNIWYDALTNLGELLRTNSQNKNLKTDWLKFLKSIDLQDIAQEPVTIFSWDRGLTR
ncbi:hypothetical protein WA1_13455 [Scytonema hofmannii PCC 7110]|uniref:DUF928 domain-containing protein n=1 Tax=Scytonema hofmannii PCC 7110 TaxID=128403 RepID=A0A139XEL5_9CYAN|nr:DUF928 domain-containing protein [Scytonema hofmannii]KYC43103.1 hypothetical protein WA1_13455 [Scytonema hofmannii PCC 7110]